MSPLITELQRVATAPYVVSLKVRLLYFPHRPWISISWSKVVSHNKLTLVIHQPTLQALLDTLTTSTFGELHTWAISHPCLLPSLASSLVSALEFCPFAQRVLEIVARERGIRDEVLRHKKTFLEGVLKSAMSSERYFHKYLNLTLSLLHHPLPQSSLPPPALLGPFFLRCVEVATTSPTPEAIRNIHTLVTSGYTHLQDLLTPPQRTMLLGRLGKFLHVEDQGAVLAALATLAHFHLEDEKAGKLQGAETERDLFSGKRIDKLLGLVCLNVVTLVSVPQGGGGEEWDARAEQVRLAGMVLRAVKDRGKEVYMASPEGVSGMKNLVRKLEKLTTEEGFGCAGCTRLLREGVRFALALAPAKGVVGVVGRPVAGLVEVLPRVLVREICGAENGLMEGELAGEIVPALVTSCSGELAELIRSTITLASTPLTFNTVTHRRLEGRSIFISALTALLPSTPSLRLALLVNVSTASFNTFLAYAPPPATIDCTALDVCPTTLLLAQKRLASTICTAFLTAGFSAQTDTIPLKLAEATSLLTLHSHLATSTAQIPQCPQTTTPRPPSPPLTLLEASATPGSTMSSHAWRDRLLHELTRDTTRQHSGILTFVGEICRDLEARCDTVERPLRESQSRCLHLQKLVDEAVERTASLEELLEGKSKDVENLDAEKERLEQQLDVAFDKTNEYEERIEALRAQIASEKDLRRKDGKEWKGKMDELEKEHLGALAEGQARVSEVEGELEGMQDTVTELGRVVEGERKVVKELTSQIEALKSEASIKTAEVEQRDGEIERIEQALCVVKASLEEKVAEVKDKESTIISLSTQITTLTHALAEKEDEITNVTSRLEEIKNELSTANQETVQLRMHLDEKSKDLAVLNDEMESSRAKHTLEITTLTETLHTRETTIKDLEHTSQSLQLTLTNTKSTHQETLERLTHDHTSALTKLQNMHDKKILHTQAKMQENRDLWSSEREGLKSKIRGLEARILRERVLQERKVRELGDVRELVGRLMVTVEGGLAGAGVAAGAGGAVAEFEGADEFSSQGPLDEEDGSENGDGLYPPQIAGNARKRRNTMHGGAGGGGGGRTEPGNDNLASSSAEEVGDGGGDQEEEDGQEEENRDPNAMRMKVKRVKYHHHHHHQHNQNQLNRQPIQLQQQQQQQRKKQSSSITPAVGASNHLPQLPQLQAVKIVRRTEKERVSVETKHRHKHPAHRGGGSAYPKRFVPPMKKVASGAAGVGGFLEETEIHDDDDQEEDDEDDDDLDIIEERDPGRRRREEEDEREEQVGRGMGGETEGFSIHGTEGEPVTVTGSDSFYGDTAVFTSTPRLGGGVGGGGGGAGGGGEWGGAADGEMEGDTTYD
ncbi:hypothetical protein DFH27DRAFT_653042 [Peziza echinospora]|nr:hypothetical protein DFH27DRAFT_653042 [Peziza echinospora]